jgi:hypothetical protein
MLEGLTDQLKPTAQRIHPMCVVLSPWPTHVAALSRAIWIRDFLMEPQLQRRSGSRLIFCSSTEYEFLSNSIAARSVDHLRSGRLHRSPAPGAVKSPEGTGTAGASASKPAVPAGDAVIDPFDQVRAYLDQTKPLREAAARIGESVARSDKPADAEAAVRARQTALAAEIRGRIRPTAKQGDIFSGASAKVIRQRLTAAFLGDGRDGVRQELQEQNDESKGNANELAVNGSFRAPKVPPEILAALPAVPVPLEYAFHDRTLIMRDADADLVIDFLPSAFPESPRQAPVAKVEGQSPYATLPLFAVPNLSGAVDLRRDWRQRYRRRCSEGNRLGDVPVLHGGAEICLRSDAG